MPSWAWLYLPSVSELREARRRRPDGDPEDFADPPPAGSAGRSGKGQLRAPSAAATVISDGSLRGIRDCGCCERKAYRNMRRSSPTRRPTSNGFRGPGGVGSRLFLPVRQVSQGPMFLSASRTDSGESRSRSRGDEVPYRLRIRLGVLAQTPADRLADEEVGVSGLADAVRRRGVRCRWRPCSGAGGGGPCGRPTGRRPRSTRPCRPQLRVGGHEASHDVGGEQSTVSHHGTVETR